MTAIEPAKRPRPAPSLEEDYALLKKGAREAGQLALTYFRKPNFTAKATHAQKT